MIDSAKAVDLIERTTNAEPACSCGRTTTTIWQDGEVWLVCSSLTERPTGRLGRLLLALTAAVHTQRPIVEIPADARPRPATASG
jgi:hypothetical protein